MNHSIENKTIFITGGNAGIGLATAELFAQNRAHVAIIGRRAEKNAIAVEKIAAHGGKCLSYTGDVTDEAFLREAIQETATAFGGLHYAFNNAGIVQPPAPILNQTVEAFRQLIDINVMGVWMAMREEIPLIQKSGGGCIVNNSSIFGHVGFAQVAPYVASKHAVVGLTKSIALEYAKENVRINAVCPGAIKTDLYNKAMEGNEAIDEIFTSLHPMGLGKTKDVASAVLYLCRDATWTTGQSIIMDGGYTAG